MPLSGTIVKKVNIKSDGNLLFETCRYRLHQISQMSPDMVKGVDLHEGEWGTVGSVIVWNLFYDGKPQGVKEVIEAIDEEKKSVRFKVIGGFVMEVYKAFSITMQVDTQREENVVTLTFDYEKVNENISDPDHLVELVLNIVKDIATYHLLQPN